MQEWKTDEKQRKTDVIKEKGQKERMQMSGTKTDAGKESRCKKEKQM